MRPTTVVLGVLGAAALVVAVVVALAIGDPGTAGWVLVGPAPFFAVGLFVALRRPDRPAGTWCLLAGTGFMVSVCLGDVVLSAVADRPEAWLVVLCRQWADYFSGVGAIGLFGWFPDGRPRRPAERWVGGRKLDLREAGALRATGTPPGRRGADVPARRSAPPVRVNGADPPATGWWWAAAPAP
jgi:hypothetical protein